MDRRESLKALLVGSVSTGVILSACEPKAPEKEAVGKGVFKDYGRTPEEALRDEQLVKETFFTAAEMSMINILVDIIIPKDEHSGSATDAKVPAFIEFMVKDQPRYQLPLRGGLRWLDVFSLKTYNKGFTDLSADDRIKLIDQIAYPYDVKPELTQGATFFSTLRNLTATGFFTSEAGLKDLDYKGNQPNVWDGVPADVLAQYNLQYDEKLLQVCLKPEDRGTIMTWEE